MLQIEKYLLEKIAATYNHGAPDDIPAHASTSSGVTPTATKSKTYKSRYIAGQRVKPRSIGAKIRNRQTNQVREWGVDDYHMDMAHNDLAEIYGHATGKIDPTITGYEGIPKGLSTAEHAAEVARINDLRKLQRENIARIRKDPAYAKFQALDKYKNDPAKYQEELNKLWKSEMSGRLTTYGQTAVDNKVRLNELYKNIPQTPVVPPQATRVSTPTTPMPTQMTPSPVTTPATNIPNTPNTAPIIKSPSAIKQQTDQKINTLQAHMQQSQQRADQAGKKFEQVALNNIPKFKDESTFLNWASNYYKQNPGASIFINPAYGTTYSEARDNYNNNLIQQGNYTDLYTPYGASEDPVITVGLEQLQRQDAMNEYHVVRNRFISQGGNPADFPPIYKWLDNRGIKHNLHPINY